MFRATKNFTIWSMQGSGESLAMNSTSYEIGDTISDADNDTVENDPHYQKFVVRVEPAA